jgi:hypothetical protein
MPVGYSPEHLFAKPFTKFHYPFLVAGWAEMAALAGKPQQKFVTAGFTFDPCKPIVEDAAIQEAMNHLFHIGTKKAVPGCEPVVIDLLQRLKVILNTLIILRLLRLAGPVGRGYVGQFPSPRKRFKGNPTRNTVN